MIPNMEIKIEIAELKSILYEWLDFGRNNSECLALVETTRDLLEAHYVRHSTKNINVG